MTLPTVLQIARVGLNVTDLQVACAFYVDALGFSLAPEGASTLSAAPSAVLRLGRQELELRVSRGRPYPEPRAANDPWFQHFAIAVSDMNAAYGRLSRHAPQPISQGGPQLLPASTGSVTAYKFRDPDGHPLELSYIPGSAWLAQAHGPDDGPCLGIDHSALVVGDLAGSIAFYRDVVGFALADEGLNQGVEQDRLDGLEQVRLDIASLCAAEGVPHIELLHYRSPRAGSDHRSIGPDDIAATRLIMRVADRLALEERLEAAKVSSTAVDGAGGRRRMRDPTGHWLELASVE